MKIQILRPLFAAYAVSAVFAWNAAAEKLPVYRLAPPTADVVKAQTLYSDAFRTKGLAGQKPGGNNFLLSMGNGKLSVEIDKRSGYFFLADENLFLQSEVQTTAPGESTARQVAEAFMQRNKLLPQSAEVKASFDGLSVTGTRFDVEGGSQERILDRHVNYSASVTVDGREYPVVGGGGQSKVVVGQGGRIVAYAGGWRPIAGVAEVVEIKSQQQAFADYMASSGFPKLTNVKMYLAYYSAPSFERQDFLAPVWVLSARIQTPAREMPLRVQIIPATKFGPYYGRPAPLLNKRGPD